MGNAPDLPGLSGALVRTVSKVKEITNIFPPAGVGVGMGIGMGCGLGWPLRRAYGPPRALCGPIIGAGFGIGYGQGFVGRRFGRDQRSEKFKSRIANVETTLDALIIRFLILVGLRKEKDGSKTDD